MGGDSKKGGGKNKAADAQARIAEHLVNQTDPLRAGLVGRSAQFLGVPAAGSGMPSGSGKDGMVRDAASGVLGPGGMIDESGWAGPTGMDMVTASPAFAEFKRATGDQFSQARENSIARLPAGGALAEALVGLEGQQAGTLSQGAGAMYEAELARAMQLATGGAAQGMSGLGQAAATQAQMAANRASVTGAKYEGLGAGAGAFLGMK